MGPGSGEEEQLKRQAARRTGTAMHACASGLVWEAACIMDTEVIVALNTAGHCLELQPEQQAMGCRMQPHMQQICSCWKASNQVVVLLSSTTQHSQALS